MPPLPSTPPKAALANSRFATPRAIMALILREMSTTYGKSPGGYIWVIIEPAAGIAILTAIFSIGFRSPPLGLNFALFYAAGMLPFLMYMDISQKLGQSIIFSQALLEYPRVTYVDAIIARLILSVVTQLLVHFLVLGAILLTTPVHTIFDFTKIAWAYAMCIALGVGVGTLNCFLIVSYPLWQTAWAIANRPLFIISCIFFLFELVPEPYGSMLWYNPLVHIIGLMRDGFYPYYHPSYISLSYVFGVSALCLMLGLLFLNRYHRDILAK